MTKKTSEKIVDYIKVTGPCTAKALAEQFSLTTMGVRQHLQGLEETGMLIFDDRKASRGRPTRYWSLTKKSDALFPDKHDDLTLQLIESVKVVFGDSGLEQLISHREEANKVLYQSALAHHASVLDKLHALARLRTDEGYVATVEQEDNHFWLLENHCPICAAASSCVNFCRSELQLFQWLFEGVATVSREEHIIEGARRCAYKVTPVTGLAGES